MLDVWHLHDNCGRAPGAGLLELSGDDIVSCIGDMHAPPGRGAIDFDL